MVAGMASRRRSRRFTRPVVIQPGRIDRDRVVTNVRDAAQLLLYKAAVNADNGIPSADDTAVAKAFCNQAGFDICNEAMQFYKVQ